MDWFAHFNGTATDAKFATVAKLAACKPYQAYAVWCALMERASEARERGSIAGFDAVDLGEAWGLDPAVISSVLEALRKRKLVTGDRITKWEDRQPQRDKSAARQAKYRKNKRAPVTGGDASPTVTTKPPKTASDGSDGGDGSRGEESEALRSDVALQHSATSIHSPPSLTREHTPEREETPKSRGRVLEWVRSLVKQEGGTDASPR